MFDRLIYVAGPYRAPTPDGVQANIERARVAAQRLWRMGYVAVCPHLNSAHFEGDSAWYLKGGLALLDACDDLYVLEDSGASKGTIAEIRLAWTKGMRIFFEGENESPDLIGGVDA